MFTLALSDNAAIAIDDEDEDEWQIHMVDFSTKSITSHDVQGIGHVVSAHYDPVRGILWVISEGVIYGILVAKQDTFALPMPEPVFHMYSVTGEGDTLYITGEYTNIWRLAVADFSWTPLSKPEPKPARSDDEEEQTRLVRAYATKYPPFYTGFKFGDEYVFCGALGALARTSGDGVERADIDTAARLVAGHEEAGRISLSADDAGGQIYKGSFEAGFEAVFFDKQPALNRTASHRGQTFIGIAEYPPCNLHNLYVLDGEELVPYETNCSREPFALISLKSTGSALWAVDSFGMFRHDGQEWSLLGINDLRQGEWPEGS